MAATGAQISQLATGNLVRERRHLLFLGPSGLGKGHLAQAIGLQAIKMGFTVLCGFVCDLVCALQVERSPFGLDRLNGRHLNVDLLIVDDMGLKPLPPKAGDILLGSVMRCYENRSIPRRSSCPIEEWGKIISDVPGTLFRQG